MKYIEIILKIAFAVGAVTFFVSQSVFLQYFSLFLVVCILLGITLIFNKDQSYGYSLAQREVVMRRIEGGVLVVFSVMCTIFKFKDLI